jgi:ATP-dependent Clp protease ATP-binding subunit ClpC
MINRQARLGFATTTGGKKEDEDYGDMSKSVMDQVRKMFRPEFLNRVDGTIIFRSLSQEEIKQIVDLEINKLRTRLIEHAITLDVTDAGRQWLATEGYDAEYGARPLRRLIQNAVEDELSEGILSGKFPVASTVTATASEDGKKLLLVGEGGETVEAAAATEEPAPRI